MRRTADPLYPGSNPGPGSILKFDYNDIKAILLQLKLSGCTDKHINDTKKRLIEFAEAVCYRINYDDILIYINKIKSKYSPEYYRKCILDIRRLLYHLNIPLADNIKLPKIPKKLFKWNLLPLFHPVPQL